jgi:hypothetical protein
MLSVGRDEEVDIGAITDATVKVDPTTAVVTVWLLFDVVGSVVAVVTDAVLTIDAPVNEGVTSTTTTKFAELLEAKEAIVPPMVPVPPTLGRVSAKVGPEICVADTNVVPAGIASLSATL